MGFPRTIGPDVLPLFFAVYAGVMLVRWLLGRRTHGLPTLALTAFVGYLLVVVGFVLLPIYLNSGSIADNLRQSFSHVSAGAGPLNFVPLVHVDVRQFLMNVALFVPMGVFLPLLYRRCAGLWPVTRAGCLISCGIEALQFVIYMVFFTGRTTDVDDVIANTAGAAVGYLVYRLLLRSGTVKRLFDGARLPTG